MDLAMERADGHRFTIAGIRPARHALDVERLAGGRRIDVTFYLLDQNQCWKGVDYRMTQFEYAAPISAF